MFHRYQYEADFYPTLSRLPLDLRRKLDLTGIKLSLKDWQAFSFEERTVLCHLPCETDDEAQAFSNYIDFLSRRYNGTAIEKIEPLNAALWQPSAVPQAVLDRSAALHHAVTLERWRLWPSHDRYALYKTAVSKSQPEDFEQVLHQVLSRAES
ncbi:MAG TPA: nitrate reductase associated protein [Candidatus Limnocylindrales bacterium]|nr:nitrate reductase associated protein [Candidatus Limnocylindrales bacterium]